MKALGIRPKLNQAFFPHTKNTMKTQFCNPAETFAAYTTKTSSPYIAGGGFKSSDSGPAGNANKA
jgi:hypothetical protein